ncbi:putative DNA modification/repair radical SAM protein [Phenylobacterium sp.]|jgi:putative DNA modification/repair radical SAM protein|uniref:putative DNA modification/repair radical SAM protein n=1 Tax=Phenylobacterium sp. TaxID=1871053 RepID=UPI000C953D49|nr:putative DNA modification/repair radical SAM protein [Phenylobacterium sp.]MAK82375.1 putative DNA modification/repair radical SAM protein [Phenylobacterium sp.]|tara:strand:- start:5475 stop:6701 length:1227 start_codon:yes stop_codon:yes gene_type:complete
MAVLDLKQKLSILADAAKYDASCASSGAGKRDSQGGKGVGSTEGMGICHAYTPDGRCVSLLKILLTNYCIYDCAYCVNRVSSNTPRARFKVQEVVDLTLGFYKRNYIEGLFLSSGIIRNSDYTMEAMVAVARSLRIEHDFRGYIHLKLIPEASVELTNEAALYADRVSINVELPREESLAAFAPEKDAGVIRKAMGAVRLGIEAGKAPARKTRPPKYAPAGQSTQMIIGADGASDGEILARSNTLYGNYGLRRVYYSAFSPIPDVAKSLPAQRPPLMREHRLYQADWLMRFYGFETAEIIAPGQDLDLAIDPKLAWALHHRESFPVDVNTASREQLLRVPGLGTRSVDRMIAARKLTRLALADVKRLARNLERLKPFVTASDWSPGALTDRIDLRDRFAPPPEQLSLF